MELESWPIRHRNYELDRKKCIQKGQPSDKHPLQRQRKQKRGEFEEPLQNKSFVDPLRGGSTKSSLIQATKNNTSIEEESKTKSWEYICEQIKTQFSSVNTLQITLYDDTGQENKVFKVDRLQSRIEQLSNTQNVQKQFMNQNEFTIYINSLIKDVATSWNQGDRVRTIKAVIQSAKQMSLLDSLGGNDEMQFYPIKFVLVTSVLDNFGSLVFDRLKRLSLDPDNLGRVKFQEVNDKTIDGSQVFEQGKETAINWFLKISCIRELVPRFYVELSLLKCYRFIQKAEEFPQILLRMATQLRGMANPIQAAYAGMYLLKQGSELVCHEAEYQMVVLQDLFYCYNLKKEQYGHFKAIFIPAFSWIIQKVGQYSDKKIFLKACELFCNHMMDLPQILGLILDSFPSNLVTGKVSELLIVINKVQDQKFVINLITSLLRNLIRAPPEKDIQFQVLNEC